MDINEPLQHYASPYYDPVKAHEYYMRTRELKSFYVRRCKSIGRNHSYSDCG